MVFCGDLITTMMTCGSLLDPIRRTPGWCWVSEVKIRLTYSDLFSRDLSVLRFASVDHKKSTEAEGKFTNLQIFKNSP